MNEIGSNLYFASSYKYIIKFKIFEKFSLNIKTRCDNCGYIDVGDKWMLEIRRVPDANVQR